MRLIKLTLSKINQHLLSFKFWIKSKFKKIMKCRKLTYEEFQDMKRIENAEKEIKFKFKMLGISIK